MNAKEMHKLLDAHLRPLMDGKNVDLHAAEVAIQGARAWTKQVQVEINYARARNKIPNIPEMKRD